MDYIILYACLLLLLFSPSLSMFGNIVNGKKTFAPFALHLVSVKWQNSWLDFKIYSNFQKFPKIPKNSQTFPEIPKIYRNSNKSPGILVCVVLLVEVVGSSGWLGWYPWTPCFYVYHVLGLLYVLCWVILSFFVFVFVFLCLFVIVLFPMTYIIWGLTWFLDDLKGQDWKCWSDYGPKDRLSEFQLVDLTQPKRGVEWMRKNISAPFVSDLVVIVVTWFYSHCFQFQLVIM